MRVKQVRLVKQFKVGLPNYSNITTTCDITWEVGENEEFDFDEGWDTVNHELYVQSDNIDATWIKTRSYKNFFKTSIKTDK